MALHSPSLVLAVAIALGIAAAAFYATGKPVPAYWLLALSPASLCGAILRDLSRGVRQIGQAAIEDGRSHLTFCLVVLVLSLLPALRPEWPWLFWIAWTLNALVWGVLLYLLLFWKVFS